jgi:ABC-type sugar transport system substrate-binding protein
MSVKDYTSMTLDEVKRYFLEHRDDQEAFHAYMDKLHASGRAIVIDPTDPDSEVKAQAAMQQKLSSHPPAD